MSSSPQVSGVLATFPGINEKSPAPSANAPSPAPRGLAAWKIFAIIFAIIVFVFVVFGLFFHMKPRLPK